MVEKLARQLDLRAAAKLVLAAIVEQDDGVVFGAERVLRKIGGEQRHFLLRALLLRVLRQLLGFRGEADTEWRLRQRRHPAEDVGILFQVEPAILAVSPLYLLAPRGL